MSSLKPYNGKFREQRNIFIHPHLSSCYHIFLRVDSVRSPLEKPYTGPYKVISRNDKTFIIEKQGKLVTVSIDRIKPAFILEDAATTSAETVRRVPHTFTRSGRRVHFPNFYT
ncbi:pol polyprotein-like protein [Leptotrombidium deliense]|uniref:Pol polyprotein-like protein n=1 Tax=Leptotrombidium deliense TaxID=299467 RepID=A0A443RXI1_9ACAR|nr:pol polyprotein-like protein [Leptotrombidium deliense]